MNARMTILIAGMLATAVALPAFAGAKDNDIDQGKFESTAETEDNIHNDWDLDQESEGDSAFSAANCQWITVVEVAITSFASGSAIALIGDEDEVAITEIPDDLDESEEALTAEFTNSTCSQPIGPVLIDITTSAGWGTASPHGSLADVVGALGGGGRGGSGGSIDNDIDQGRFEMDAEMKDNILNEWTYDQDNDYGGNDAMSASSCQGIVTARAAVLALALGDAEANIEDSDSVVITGAGDGVGTSDFTFNETEPGEFEQVTVENNHVAYSWCTQTVESVTILIRPETEISPGS